MIVRSQKLVFICLQHIHDGDRSKYSVILVKTAFMFLVYALMDVIKWILDNITVKVIVIIH